MKKINDIIISPNSPASNNVGWVKTEEDKLTLKFLINGKWKGINGVDNFAVEGTNVDLNTYISDGVYFFSNKRLTNVPILNDSVVSARLTVLTAYDGVSPVITQVLNLNNLGGGEGNIYIRSNQNGEWKPWGKLQTNVEVGQITPDKMNSIIDNGIYSGVYVDGTTVETFVLIVINNYLAATQAGFGGYISQLKYSIDLNRGNTVKTRTRDAYGIWNEWSEIGGSTYELPVATHDKIGGVKLGITTLSQYAPLVNIGTFWNNGVGIGVDVNYFTKLESNDFLSIKCDTSLCHYGHGLSVKLGSTIDNEGYGVFSAVIPLVMGTAKPSDGSKWNHYPIGVPYNTKQFCLKENGLNLTYIDPNTLRFSTFIINTLGIGTFEIAGSLTGSDEVGSIWRYIYETLEIEKGQFSMKLTIDSETRATAIIIGCGKYDIVTFNPSNSKEVTSIK